MGFGIDPATREAGLEALSSGGSQDKKVAWAMGEEERQLAEELERKQALAEAEQKAGGIKSGMGGGGMGGFGG